MKNLTEGNIYKNFMVFAIPIVLSGLLSQLYDVVDGIIAGKYLGETGLGAIGATSALITFFSSAFWGYGTGASVLTATLFGSKDYRALKENIYNNAMVIICATLAVSIISIIFRNLIFDLLRVDDAIRKDALTYFLVYIGGFGFFMLSHYGISVMHALGISGYSLKMSVLSTIINISGNILSVTVFDLGVLGIGIASVVAALAVCVCYYFKLRKCFRELGVHKYRVKLSFGCVKKTFGFSLPVMVQQSVMYVTSILVAPIVNSIGSSATAAYSIAMRIYNINAGVYQNSSKTLTNYTAQCVGAGKTGEIKKGIRVGLIQALIFLAPFLIVSVGFAEKFCRVFFPSGFEGQALDYCVTFAKFFLPFIVFNVINNLFHSFFRGIKAMGHLVAFTAIGSVSRIIATFVLASYGMVGVYWAWVFSWIFESVALMINIKGCFKALYIINA